MKAYGLLGAHLSHSHSKLIHSLIFKVLNIEASYQLIECEEFELKNYITALKEGKFQGLNVTIPYKKTILSYLDEIDEKAKTIGSVNTVYLRNGKTIGTNTDYDGFLETIHKYQIEVLKKDCYILGTGGASLAVHQVLKDLGGNCFFVSRTPTKDQISYEDLEKRKIDLLVNTTPVGMFPNVSESPVSSGIAKGSKNVIDIIFNPKKTKLLKDANSKMNGLYMLLMQAIKAEEIWHQKPIQINTNELLTSLEQILELPKEIATIIHNLPFKKDKVGLSKDVVYIFDNQYVLKISKNCERLRKEKERTDWLNEYIPGSKSIAYIEQNSIGYYLRTFIQGDNLLSNRFLEHPVLLIQTLKKVVRVLRSLDQKNCPFLSADSEGNDFTHGDLCLPNIYVDAYNNFCGFIDLDNAGLGDANYDYAWLLWSFEYNVKTNQYNELLLKELDIKLDEKSYLKYIPKECLEMLKR